MVGVGPRRHTLVIKTTGGGFGCLDQELWFNSEPGEGDVASLDLSSFALFNREERSQEVAQ